MDLPTISIVVQWKATCDLCTLWQRFGRAARGPGQQGTAILLVEKKDTDDERQAKAKKIEEAALKKSREGIGTGSKRKAADQSHQPAKRLALTDRTSLTTNVDNIGSSASSTPSTEPSTLSMPVSPPNSLKEERRSHYAKRTIKTSVNSTMIKGKGKGKPAMVVGSAMDDFINVHLTFACRRVVPMLVFGNDTRRKSFTSNRVTMTYLRSGHPKLPTITFYVMNHCLKVVTAVDRGSLLSAVISATLTHSRASTFRLVRKFSKPLGNHKSSHTP